MVRMMFLFRLVIVLLSVISFVDHDAVAGAEYLDSRVKPGERFTLIFEDLGPTWHGWSTRMEVYIPTDYDAERRYPLLVWFSGSVGSHTVGRPLSITEGKGFILASLPYRKPEEDKHSDNTGWQSDWSYYWTMLKALEKTVPNIHPGKRICGGFSSGGLAVTWSIANSGGAFQKYFYGFIPGGAGGNFGKLNTIKGRPMLMYMGDQDKRYEEFSKIFSVAKSAGVDVEFLVFEGVGHVLPESSFPQIVDWMKRKVVQRDLPDAMDRLDVALKTRNWSRVISAVKAINEIAEAGMPEYRIAQKALAQACEAGNQALEALLGTDPSERAWRRFIDQWEGCPCVEKAVNMCNTIGLDQLEEVLSRKDRTLAVRLMAFMKRWEGFPVYEQAVLACDEAVRPELMRIRSRTKNKYKLGAQLKNFADRWAPTPSAKEAMSVRNKLAEELFSEISAVRSKQSRWSKLRRFVQDYGDTDAGQRAGKLLR